MVEGAHPHRLDCIGGCSMSGEDRHNRRLLAAAHPPQQFQAVHAWHPQVQERGVDLLHFKYLQCRSAGSGYAYLVPEIAYHLGECVPYDGIIVNDQDGCHGSITSKTVPESLI